jgi:glycosyltransferase involved in cell wall biosynthesis
VTNPSPADGRPTRIAYLSYSTAQFDSRSHRMARSAVAAGDEVTILARWEPGLPLEELADGYRVVRVPFDVRLAIPGLRAEGRRRVAARLALEAEAARRREAGRPSPPVAAGELPGVPAPARSRRFDSIRRRTRGTRFSPFLRGVRGFILSPRRLITFPLRPIAWAVALEAVAEPADIWHGMWAGSLPALGRLRRRHGGRTIYDSRDIYLHARAFDRMGAAWRRLYLGLERRWAASADAVLTVNDAYAEILERTLRIPRPPVVMNCPERWTPPDARPDLIRERLGLGASTAVVLYQGNLMTERGIEESVEAILGVPGAVLVLLGYGGSRDAYAAMAQEPRFTGHVHLLPPVSPTELLTWTASADVLVMAIQPTTLNHRFTTPQKLWESMAVGVPVVASDLPGMASVVTATGCGVLCDPTSPASIATAIRSILDAPAEEQAAMRRRAFEAARTTYNWEAQLVVLRRLYADLLAR